MSFGCFLRTPICASVSTSAQAPARKILLPISWAVSAPMEENSLQETKKGSWLCVPEGQEHGYELSLGTIAVVQGQKGRNSLTPCETFWLAGH